MDRRERIVAATVAALVVVGGIGPVVAAGGTTEAPGQSGVAPAATASTDGVTVSVEPNRTSVDAGNATTLTVVVRGADRGVGSYEVTVDTSDPSIASVEAATAEVGTLTSVDVASDGSGATVSGAGGDAGGPTVTVATVTVRGETDGSVSLSVSAETIADPEKDSYAVDGTDPAAVDVVGDAVELVLSANRTRVAPDEAVGFAVSRADTGDPVDATLTADGRSKATGSDGSVAFEFDADGRYTVTASKSGGFLNDSLAVTVGSGTAAVDVSLDPRLAVVEVGNRTRLDVVVDGFTDGIGTYEVVVNTTDAGAAPVVDATKRVEGQFGLAPTVADDGSGARLRALRADTASTGPLVLGSVTLRGDAAAAVDVRVTEVTLGNESQETYDVAGIDNASVSVERRLVSLAVALDPATVQPGDPVLATVRREDTDERVNATVRVDGTARSTGEDGTAAFGLESTGDYAVTATRADTASETYANVTATLRVRERVRLSVSLNRSDAPAGDPVLVTVRREDTGERVNATVRVDDTARSTGENGETTVRLAAAGNYTLRATKPDTATETYANATATLQIEPVGPGRDLDGDGLFEDVDADGDFDVVDVAVLLSTFGEKRERGYVDRFDFKPDGRLNVLDVAVLLERS